MMNTSFRLDEINVAAQAQQQTHVLFISAVPSTTHPLETNIHAGASTAGTAAVLFPTLQGTSSETHRPPLKEEEQSEKEWDEIIAKPRVMNAIRRMAAQARAQLLAGETEEGGFGAD